MRYGTLFSGIDGFAVGFDRLGWDLRWQVEQDPFCLDVLRHHWPDVPKHEDVCAVGAHNLEPVDVVAGGFPCQDLSLLGRGEGLAGARSGLWSEMLRVVRELRPRYVVVENVTALLGRGLDVVLGDLAAIGFDAEWDCVPASAVGAPHRRDRIWLVAYPGGERRREDAGGSHADEGADAGGRAQDDHVTGGSGPRRLHPAGRQAGVADTGSAGLEGRRDEGSASHRARQDDPWEVEPDVGRVADGVPARVDRLRALGNALVPQIPEWIGRRIEEFEEGRMTALGSKRAPQPAEQEKR